MAIRGNFPLLVLLLSFLFVFATVTLATEDPELKQCKQQCRVQRQFDRRQKQECEERCEKEKKRREEGGGGGGDEFWNAEGPLKKLRDCEKQCDRREDQDERTECRRQCAEEFRREKEERGGSGRDNKKDPEEQYRRCKEGCQSETERRGQQQRCEQRCEKEYREQRRGGEGNPWYDVSEEESERQEQQESSKPYVFEDHHFTTKAETQYGRVRVLPKFTERSKLLRGIENYRVAILEAKPQTFVVPNHWDAEGLFFVSQGRGTITLVRQDRRESFNLRCGDILRIPAGTTVYLINRSNNEKLVIIKLLQPVSIPGHFEPFFGPGGEDPESYFRVFSPSLLEAALNTKRDKIQKLFGQRQGIIIKASEEQIKAMTHHEEGGGIWPFGGKSKQVFNLFHKHPSQSNQYGQLYEVDPNDRRDLQELNLAIGFANFTGGSMTAPYYNSRATKIAVVTNGEGYFEMACPHISSSEFSRGRERQEGGGGSHQQDKSSQGYQKVSGRLRRGVVFIVPAGHPVITVASKNQNLQIVYFNINAVNNEKFPLAGRRNIINQIEPEAKELAFNAPARDVDEVFTKQKEEFFFEGPRQQHEHEHEEKGRAYA